jgi:glycosyltransferase involved in cell wall biosynthesis
MRVTQVDLLSPAYSEAKNLEQLVETVLPLLAAQETKWDVRLLIVVNDNDPDETPQVADQLAANNAHIDVVHRTDPPSFGGAIKTGLRAIDGDVVVPIMADLSDDIEAIPEFVSSIEDGYDFVHASRFIDGGSVERYPPLKLIANRLFNTVSSMMFGLETTDLSNGFSAYHADVIEEIGVDSLKSESFDITIELKLLAHIHGYKSTEVAATWQGRDAGDSKFDVLEQGKRYTKRSLGLWLFAQKQRFTP